MVWLHLFSHDLNCIVLTFCHKHDFRNIQQHDRLNSVCVPEEERLGTEMIYS